MDYPVLQEARLKEAMEVIREEAAKPFGGAWQQGTWRCQTGMCLGGWVVTLNGGVWANDTQFWNPLFSYLKPEEEEHALGIVHVQDDMQVVSVADRAQRLLGITYHEATALFTGNNTIDDLEEMVGILLAGERDVIEAPDHDDDNVVDDDEDYDE